MVKHEGLESGARIDHASLPPQKPISPAQRISKLRQKRNLIQTLDRLLKRKMPPDDFLVPLGNLLDGIQHKAASLQDVTFFRARVMDTDLFTHTDELKYPPPEHSLHGRLNKKGNPILYAAYSPAASIVEISAKVGQTLAIAIIKELPGHADRVRYFPIGMPASSQYATPTRDRAEQLVHDYLNSEMSKRVNKGEEHLYNSTIAIAENFLGKPLLHLRYNTRLETGLIYPSVRADQSLDTNSYNVAMKPEVFDAHFRIVEIKSFIIMDVNDIRQVNHATVREDGTLDWEQAWPSY